YFIMATVLLSLLLFLFSMLRRLSRSTLFPYTTLFRSKINLTGDSVLQYDTESKLELPKKIRSVLSRKKTPTAFVTYNDEVGVFLDRKSTRLNSSHVSISYAVFCLKKKNKKYNKYKQNK